MRKQGTKYLHVHYEPGPDHEGAVKPHEFLLGNECWCEPKCWFTGSHVLVVHDPEDGLVITEDSGK